MIKSILKVGLLLVIGILGYNYFFGTAEEKAQAKEIIGKGVDVGKASVDLLKGEVAKFKSGKYDDALDKIGGLLEKTKEKVKDGSEMLDKIEEWENAKANWTERKEAIIKDMKDGDEEQHAEAVKKLNEEAERLEAEGKKLEEAAGSN